MLTVPTSVDQDTYGKAIKHEKTQPTIKPGGQLFPSRCPQGCKEQTILHNKDKYET